jgi:drug/metabolite transporter (DMT)-like permease
MSSQPPPYGGSPPEPPPHPSSAPAPYYPQQPYYPAPQAGNGLAVAGGVIGIVALVLSFIPFIDFFAVILGVLAIIFGAIGNSRARRLGGASRGMAITGIVCGIIAVAVSILFIVAVYSAVYHFSTTVPSFTFNPSPT